MERNETRIEILKAYLDVVLKKMVREAEQNIKDHFDSATGLLAQEAVRDGSASSAFREAMAKVEMGKEQSLRAFQDFQAMFQEKINEMIETKDPQGMADFFNLAESIVEGIEDGERKFLENKKAIVPMFEWLTFDQAHPVPEERALNLWRSSLTKFGVLKKETIH